MNTARFSGFKSWFNWELTSAAGSAILAWGFWRSFCWNLLKGGNLWKLVETQKGKLRQAGTPFISRLVKDYRPVSSRLWALDAATKVTMSALEYRSVTCQFCYEDTSCVHPEMGDSYQEGMMNWLIWRFPRRTQPQLATGYSGRRSAQEKVVLGPDPSERRRLRDHPSWWALQNRWHCPKWVTTCILGYRRYPWLLKTFSIFLKTFSAFHNWSVLSAPQFSSCFRPGAAANQ